MSIAWESDKYHDFYVDLYDSDGNLVVSKIVEDEYEALIQGVDPGKYFLYITALRRGSKVEKAQDCVTFEVTQAESAINEIILDKDDTYYFVYEDEALDFCTSTTKNWLTLTKRTKKRQRADSHKERKSFRNNTATKGYRQLAKYRNKMEYTTGDPVIRTHMLTGDNEKGNAIVSDENIGCAVCMGGTTPNGFDCSGLVQYVCNSLYINVNRVAEDQFFKNGTAVNKDELQPGDLCIL